MVYTLLPAKLYKPTSIWYNRGMKVTVGNYYHDEARDRQQEIHITLEDSDGEDMFKDWASIPNAKKVEKLTALADIYTLTYAMARGYTQEESTKDRTSRLLKTYIV